MPVGPPPQLFGFATYGASPSCIATQPGRLGALATRTISCTPTSENYPSERGGAAGAGPSPSPVGDQVRGVSPSVGIEHSKVAKTRPLPFDRPDEHLFDGTVESVGPGPANSPGAGVDPRRPQCLIRVDVPDPGDGPLTQQKGLDGSGRSGELGGEAVGIELVREWLGAEARQARYYGVVTRVNHRDASETARVPHHKLPAVVEP